MLVGAGRIGKPEIASITIGLMGRSLSRPGCTQTVSGRFAAVLGSRSLAGPSETELEQRACQALQHAVATNDADADEALIAAGNNSEEQNQAIADGLQDRIDSGKGLSGINRNRLAVWLEQARDVYGDNGEDSILWHMIDETKTDALQALRAIPLIDDRKEQASQIAGRAFDARWEPYLSWKGLANKVGRRLNYCRAIYDDAEIARELDLHPKATPNQQPPSTIVINIAREFEQELDYLAKSAVDFRPTPQILGSALERARQRTLLNH